MQFSPGPADSSLWCLIFLVRLMTNAGVNWMIVEIGYILYPQHNSHLVSLVRIFKPTYMSTQHWWNLSWCWEKSSVEILLVIPRKIFTIWQDMSCCQAILSFWPKVVFERLNLWQKMLVLIWLVIEKIWHNFPLNSLSSFEIHFHCNLADVQELKQAMNERISDVSSQVTKQFGSQRPPALFRARSLHPLEFVKKKSGFFRKLIIERIWHIFPLMWLRCFQNHFCCTLAAFQHRKQVRNEQSADLTLEVAKELRSQKSLALFVSINLHCLGWNFFQTVGSLTVAATSCVLS